MTRLTVTGGNSNDGKALENFVLALRDETNKKHDALLAEMTATRDKPVGWFSFNLPYTDVEAVTERLAIKVFGPADVEVDANPPRLRIHINHFNDVAKAIKDLALPTGAPKLREQDERGLG